MTLKVDLEDFKKYLNYIKEINTEELCNIEFRLNGEIIPVDPKEIEEVRYVSLSNCMFVQGLVRIHIDGKESPYED